jgi:hypothetical protein
MHGIGQHFGVGLMRFAPSQFEVTKQKQNIVRGRFSGKNTNKTAKLPVPATLF